MAQGRGPLPVAGPAQQRGPFGDGNGPGPGFPARSSDGGGRGQDGGFNGQAVNRPDGGFGDGGRGGPGAGTSPAMIEFLLANPGQTRYLVAAPSANAAAPIILATAQPVMALGGFSGGDPIITADELARACSRGTFVSSCWVAVSAAGAVAAPARGCNQIASRFVGGSGRSQ